MGYKKIRQPAVNVYKPQGSAVDFLSCKDLAVLYAGTVGAGKSLAALTKIHFLCTKYPNTRALILRATRKSLNDTTLRCFEDYVIKDSYLTQGARRPFRQSYDYKNGSQITLAGLDQWSKLMGMDLDLIFIDEAAEIDETSYITLLTRFRGPQHTPYRQMVCCTNPSYPTHWLLQKANAKEMTHIVATMEDNPLLWDADRKIWTPQGEQYRSTLATMTGLQRDRLVLGKWAGGDGLAYPEFSPIKHVVPRPDKETIGAMRLIGGIDFGATDPMVIQVWGKDGDGVNWLLSEYYRTEMQISSVVTVCKEFSRRYKNIETWVCDPSAKMIISYLQENGLNCTKGQNAIKEGCQLARNVIANDRLRVANDYQETIDTNLRAKKAPTCFTEEILSYAWDETKDMPLKGQADHSMDNFKYSINYLNSETNSFHFAISGGDEVDSDDDDNPTWINGLSKYFNR
jgi:phage terminase large subunit